MLEITKINTIDEVNNAVIRERAERARNGKSQEFCARLNGTEVALLSYENWSEDSSGFIYEIYVLPDFRKRGIGGELLSHAESVARQLGHRKIRLKANAFDHTVDIKWLISWYTRKGYLEIAERPYQMEKTLS